MKIRTNSQGFSAVEALLILVIISLVGFVGWFVYHSQKSVDKTYSNAANDSAQKVTAIKTFADCKKAAGSKILTTYPEQCVSKFGKTFTDTTQTTNQQTSQKYLIITEWGVRFPFNSSDTLTYHFTGNDKGTIEVVSAQLAAKYPGCEKFGAGMIS